MDVFKLVDNILLPYIRCTLYVYIIYTCIVHKPLERSKNSLVKDHVSHSCTCIQTIN